MSVLVENKILCSDFEKFYEYWSNNGYKNFVIEIIDEICFKIVVILSFNI
jgi:hypothetical protein